MLNGIALASKPRGSCTVLAELRSKMKVALSGDKVSILFFVKDDGEGMSEAECEAMFMPFSRLKPGNSGATALHAQMGKEKISLSATKQILEVHGAKVGYESSIGKGSTFFFQIELALPSKVKEQSDFLTTEILNVQDVGLSKGPSSSLRRSIGISSDNASTVTLREAAVQTAATATRPDQSSALLEGQRYLERADSPSTLSAPTSSADITMGKASVKEGEVLPDVMRGQEVNEGASVAMKTNRRVLLVDDVKSNRRMYGRILELLGFEVDTADDGLQALEKVRSNLSLGTPFVLVLIDNSMVEVPSFHGCYLLK